MSHVCVALAVVGRMEGDRIFDPASGRDNVLERFHLLREHLRSNGMVCRTADMFDPSSIDVLIFHDIMNDLDTILRTIKANPLVKLIYVPNEPDFVIPLHDETIIPQLPVDVVLTWNDRIADKFSHVIKCNIGQPIIVKEGIPIIPFNEKEFICSIFAYKPSTVAGTLFQERIRAVDFFSEQAYGMDLYGIGWETSGFHFVSASYKGPCKSKKEVLKKYKFSIAYENIGTIPGLITEKIFDCFAAGTIPVYLGAPNISNSIPASCFIDVRDFEGYTQLYEYLVNMSEDRYQQYLEAAKDFIQTPEYNFFTSKQYAELMVKQVKILMDKNKVARTPACLKWSLIKLIIRFPHVLKNWKPYKRMAMAMALVW